VQHSIFIGYRRDDTADASGRVYDRLRGAFGAEAVFKDVDNLDPGVEFGEYILTILPKCRVFLAMIGPQWTDIRNEAGQRRLEDPKDWVRIELETALDTPGLQLVPVLVNGAPMPRSEQLPPSLQRLPGLNAAIVRRDPDFHRDMDKLIKALEAGVRTGRVEVEAAPGGPDRGQCGCLEADREQPRSARLCRFHRVLPRHGGSDDRCARQAPAGGLGRGGQAGPRSDRFLPARPGICRLRANRHLGDAPRGGGRTAGVSAGSGRARGA
jgi:hypothetical protein